MAHLTIHGVTADLRPLVEDFLGLLPAHGHSGSIAADDAQAPAVDPFAGVDIDRIPDQLLVNMGISREELRRGREMRPAVDVNAVSATADTTPVATASPATSSGLPTP